MPTCKHPRKACGLISVLSSVACEWMLILLMLLSAILNHFLTEFARYCELEMPCPLCSRLDRCVGHEGLEFFSDILCKSHRVEISYLISCYIHGKLVDVRGLCEDCLSSSTFQSASSSLLGIGYSGFSSSFQKTTTSSSSCTCCKRSKSIPKKQPPKSPLARSSKHEVSFPSSVGRGYLNHRKELRRMRNRVSRSASLNQKLRNRFDPLSYVGYCELKISSDSEGELRALDDDGNEASQEYSVVQKPSKGIHRMSETSSSRRNNSSQSAPPLLLDLNELPKNGVPQYIKPPDAIWHSLGELNWQQNDPRSGLRTVDAFDGNPSSSSEIDVRNRTEKSIDLTAPISSIQLSQKQHASDSLVRGHVDGSVVDSLRRQVEDDEICINELYKELEEERNAAAVAANQAMAMINKLQEEKATLYMEALQYLRMMEQQAENDVDALEKANTLLVDKEKEIQDLEAEIESYKSRFTDESVCCQEF